MSTPSSGTPASPVWSKLVIVGEILKADIATKPLNGVHQDPQCLSFFVLRVFIFLLINKCVYALYQFCSDLERVNCMLLELLTGLRLLVVSVCRISW